VNQNDTRAALEAAARSTYNAYWDFKDAALKQPLATGSGSWRTSDTPRAHR